MTKKWWHDKIAYQIYPKSFYDSNGDGIGDIRGIISKLDYLKDLGIDIIWISPIYQSPLADQGYDISDYYDIDPRFGTMADMDELLAEAKKRDMHILMDLVVNHCSDEHEWFKKACEDPDGYYGKFFYIYDHKEGEPLPSNLRSYFGGPCFSPLPGHPDKVYFHAFHEKQPDLNWTNPELKAEIFKMINWWLDKGLDGFRIDAIINIRKALPFKQYPADRDDGLAVIFNMLEEAEGVVDDLRELNENTFKKHESLAIAELFNWKQEDLPDYIGEDGVFSTIFDFDETIIGHSFQGWYKSEPVEPEQYKDAILDAHLRAQDYGFLSNIIENHDESRGVSRYIPGGDVTDVSKKMLAGVYFMMPGLPFIYQGQEIGMENVDFKSIDEINDINTLDEYQTSLNAGLSPMEALESVKPYSRDNARTPFQWTKEANAGFSTGEPWLKVNPNYDRINLASQIDDETSVFSFYKELIKLKKNPEYKETLTYGRLEAYKREQKNLLAYTRTADKCVMVIANYQKEAQTVELEKPIKKVLLGNLPAKQTDNEGRCKIELASYELVIVEI